jgi:regulator of chromosome condensation (RCC1) repeat-containing protein
VSGKALLLILGIAATPDLASSAKVISIWGGARHCIVLKSDGTVWAWGWNVNGQLGDGTTTDRNRPVPVIGLGGAPAVPALDRLGAFLASICGGLVLLQSFGRRAHPERRRARVRVWSRPSSEKRLSGGTLR